MTEDLIQPNQEANQVAVTQQATQPAVQAVAYSVEVSLPVTQKYKFNPDTVITKKVAMEMRKIQLKGLKLTVQNGKTEISNPDQSATNEEMLQVELVKLYWGIPTVEEVLELSDTDFRKLYEPIKKLDPLGTSSVSEEKNTTN